MLDAFDDPWLDHTVRSEDLVIEQPLPTEDLRQVKISEAELRHLRRMAELWRNAESVSMAVAETLDAAADSLRTSAETLRSIVRTATRASYGHKP